MDAVGKEYCHQTVKENKKLCLEKDLGRLPELLLALFLIPIPLLSGEVLRWVFLKFWFQFQWFISPAGPLQVCNCHDGVYIVVDKAAIHTMH